MYIVSCTFYTHNLKVILYGRFSVPVIYYLSHEVRGIFHFCYQVSAQKENVLNLGLLKFSIFRLKMFNLHNNLCKDIKLEKYLQNFQEKKKTGRKFLLIIVCQEKLLYYTNMDYFSER